MLNFVAAGKRSTYMSDDQHLLGLLVQGSESAFEQLYMKYHRAAVDFCQSFLKDRAESESVVQDVFVQFWEKRALFSVNIHFKSYLFASLRNKIFDYLKSVKRDEAATDRLWEKVEWMRQHPEEDLQQERLIRLFNAIEELPDGRRRILELRYLEGCSYEEIADKLQISTNTVKNQLISARHFLKAHFNLNTFLFSLIMLFLLSVGWLVLK